ncbi:hypothetical protein ACOME3_006328 [Neoechinorhynchus agilis]
MSIKQLTASAMRITVGRFKNARVHSRTDNATFKIQQTITNLLRDERIEGPLHLMDISRQYTERLIQLATKYPYDQSVMDIIDFWVLEKDLIPKIYEVLISRFKDRPNGPYTNQYRISREYPIVNAKSAKFKGVLELKGNGYPPLPHPQYGHIPACASSILTNVLVGAAARNEQIYKHQDNKFRNIEIVEPSK